MKIETLPYIDRQLVDDVSSKMIIHLDDGIFMKFQSMSPVTTSMGLINFLRDVIPHTYIHEN